MVQARAHKGTGAASERNMRRFGRMGGLLVVVFGRTAALERNAAIALWTRVFDPGTMASN